MKKYSILISFLVLNIGFCLAENSEKDIDDFYNFSYPSVSKIIIEKDSNYVYHYVDVDKKPEFIGGNDSLYRFIAKNLKYPNTDVDAEDLVVCQFIVEKDGSISNIIIEQSIELPFDKEAIRVLELMPNWIPAEKNGKKVRVYKLLPINFKLQ